MAPGGDAIPGSEGALGAVAAGCTALLTLDCGNSTLDCLDHATGRRLRWPHGADRAVLDAFLSEVPAGRCAGVAVNHHAVLDHCAHLLERRGLRLLRVGVELSCPMPLDYETPQTLGADRWLGALAAHRRHGAAVVVDCGSATTVNVVDAAGVFRGGAIAPGLGALAAGMAAATPRLPAARLGSRPSLPPRSSQAAVDTGVLLGFCGMVERLVADHRRVLRGSATVVVTGGNADLLLSHTRLLPVHEPDLVHAGLAQLLREAPCAG